MNLTLFLSFSIQLSFLLIKINKNSQFMFTFDTITIKTEKTGTKQRHNNLPAQDVYENKTTQVTHWMQFCSRNNGTSILIFKDFSITSFGITA